MKVLFFVLFSSILLIKIASRVSSLNPDSVIKDDLDTIAEDEMMMESEASRRLLLMGRRYISYETLRRDVIPCGTPGASYYNCKGNGNGVANPYNRGCEIITMCARDAINT
ncbi:unnamed protein product [Lactuca saligna]|uniref:Rapid ALkalinization Factor n=1 Tax=Lactuca saligna TaxID=75948 RepID=A0AA35ZD78_LACSI|nr:unnamed protein product [Lactuca saligna]